MKRLTNKSKTTCKLPLKSIQLKGEIRNVFSSNVNKIMTFALIKTELSAVTAINNIINSKSAN